MWTPRETAIRVADDAHLDEIERDRLIALALRGAEAVAAAAREALIDSHRPESGRRLRFNGAVVALEDALGDPTFGDVPAEDLEPAPVVGLDRIEAGAQWEREEEEIQKAQARLISAGGEAAVREATAALKAVRDRVATARAERAELLVRPAQGLDAGDDDAPSVVSPEKLAASKIWLDEESRIQKAQRAFFSARGESAAEARERLDAIRREVALARRIRSAGA